MANLNLDKVKQYNESSCGVRHCKNKVVYCLHDGITSFNLNLGSSHRDAGKLIEIFDDLKNWRHTQSNYELFEWLLQLGQKVKNYSPITDINKSSSCDKCSHFAADSALSGDDNGNTAGADSVFSEIDSRTIPNNVSNIKYPAKISLLNSKSYPEGTANSGSDHNRHISKYIPHPDELVYERYSKFLENLVQAGEKKKKNEPQKNKRVGNANGNQNSKKKKLSEEQSKNFENSNIYGNNYSKKKKVAEVEIRGSDNFSGERSVVLENIAVEDNAASKQVLVVKSDKNGEKVLVSSHCSDTPVTADKQQKIGDDRKVIVASNVNSKMIKIVKSKTLFDIKFAH